MNIASEKAVRPGFTDFIFSHKGDLTLALSALIYLISWICVYYSPWKTPAEIAVSIAEAALVGGLCDYIALKMIFERRWYLPNSGVLPRNREKLIEGIAATIENEWLTPQMIGRKLNEMDLVGRLGTFLEEVKIDDLLGQAGLERILNRIIAYLESPAERHRLDAMLKKALPKTFTRVYALMNRFGADSMSTKLATNLRRRLPQLRNDPVLLETIENAIHEFGTQLHDPDSYGNRLARQIIDTMLARMVDASRGQIAHMVRENLASLDDEQIRIQIESKTRTHLDWIRVNGGIFGAFFGLIFAMIRLLVAEGPAMIARLHLVGM
ncbi:MAG: putative rane protein [Candidatus Binatus sp.]|jgi:uncharacterized membrane-anchored protein YjiN (DUF445 family)|nr:putative rane protein [Candidatus Binatus sp.]